MTSFGENPMTIDLFSFDLEVNPLAVHKAIQYKNNIADISNEKELKPICAVNCFNDTLPITVKYITEYSVMSSVDLNFDSKLLCSCDCTDKCLDNTKCL